MATEELSPRYRDLDAWSIEEGLDALFQDQLVAVAAVRPALPAIARAVEAAVERLEIGNGGRLIYAGAGTSARIGVQDGVELPPTFNWSNSNLGFAIAGGEDAILKAVENAEDSGDAAIERIDTLNVGASDVVIGLAASGTTPYTIGALRRAAERGALTIGIANNADTPVLQAAACPILVETGAEVVAGSTRLKAGTAQKIVLNLLSTMLMIRLGRVYQGMMVHMRATNAKLRKRSETMVARISGCDSTVAAQAIATSDGDVKLASLLAMGIDQAQAKAALVETNGNLRASIALAAADRSGSLDGV